MSSNDIVTSRLTVTPFSEAYLSETYVSWLNDPEVVKYSEQRFRRHTLESCREYLASFADSGNFFWAILTQERRHIGNINAYVDDANRSADIGIMIGDRSVWGQGYASEAWGGVCRYLFDRARIRKITAGTMAVNRGMIKVMEHNGMVPDGIRRRHFLYEGQEIDLVHMARFNPEYRAAAE